MATSIDEDTSLLHVSSLPMENRFHPLLETNREEEVYRIVASQPLSIIHKTPTVARYTPTINFKSVLHRLARHNSISEMIVLHDLGQQSLRDLELKIIMIEQQRGEHLCTTILLREMVTKRAEF